MNQIWKGIRGATVCVAELTGRNPNVMYELGLAHAIRKPVVLIVQSVDDIPFDLRHLRHIVYDTRAVDWAQVLQKRIKTRLAAVLTDPEASLAFEDDEFWRLKLRVSTANSGTLTTAFTMRAKDGSLYLDLADASTRV